jgi:hypothetical protein
MLPLAVEITDSLTVGEFAVGAGTFLLALFTVYLGWETRKSAKAARDAVESSEVPFVIASATDKWEKVMKLRPHENPQRVGGKLPPLAIHRAVEEDGETHFVRLKLWNIGLGPAIVEEIHLRRAGMDFLDGPRRSISE